MAVIEIPQLPTLATTVDTDLLHVRSGSVDYKATKAVLLEGLNNDELKGLLTSTGSNSAYILTTGGNLNALSVPMAWVFKSNHSSTGACTLQIDSAGAVGMVDLEGNDFIADDIDSGGIYFAVYDGTKFIAINAPWTGSTTNKGMVEVATVAEADAGVATDVVVTPQGLLSSILLNAPAPSDASTIAKGIIEIATNTETQDGVLSTLAVSPKGLASLTASETRDGLAEIATQAEIDAGIDDARYSTPLKLKNWVRDATESVKGFVQRATQAEADAQSDTTKYVTPAHLSSLGVTGSVVMMASTVVPTGHLECNGAEISRTTYASLYAAIGNTWGIGDGSTTFNIPDMRGEFPRGWDNGKGVDSGRVVGVSQGDEIKSHRHELATDQTGSENLHTVSDTGLSDESFSGTAYTQFFGDTETRPRNHAFMFCIRT